MNDFRANNVSVNEKIHYNFKNKYYFQGCYMNFLCKHFRSQTNVAFLFIFKTTHISSILFSLFTEYDNGSIPQLAYK